MKAARLHAVGDLRIEEIPAPDAPEPGAVLLKVLAAGICGSDVHNFRTGQWIAPGPARVAGHEFAATVVACGDGVDDLSPGDLVVADSRFWCGTCDACRDGRRNLCRHLGFVGEVCDGGFAPLAALPRRLVEKVPGSVDPRAAAMAEPLAVALHAVRRLAAPAAQPVLVVGCGPIGGLAALLLSREPGRTVLVADRNEARAALVAEVTGAAVVPLAADTLAGVRYALDATGSTAAIEAIVRSLGTGGALALVGISHGAVALDPNILVEREIALIGCHAFADELPEAAALLEDLQPALLRLVDGEIDVGGIPAAYERIMSGAATGLKTIVRPA